MIALLFTLMEALTLAARRLLLLVMLRPRLLLLATLGARGVSLADSGSVSLLRCRMTQRDFLQAVGVIWKQFVCGVRLFNPQVDVYC